MARGLGTLTVWLAADTKGLASGFANAQKMLLSWKGAIAGALAGVGLGAFAKSSVEAFMESEDAAAQLQRALESTDFASGFDAKRIQDYAAELQKTTRFEDDAIAKGMALLATFTNIKGDNFKAAAKSALDLSTVMGTDLQSSIVQIGKALNNPIQGISALSRVGVSFSETQKLKIAELIAQGKDYQAQLVILTELQKEFGGQAEAAAGTTAGRLAQLLNAWGDIKETLGELIVDVLDLNGLFGDGTGSLQAWGDAFKSNVLPIAMQIKSVFVEIKYALLQTGTAIANLGAPVMSIFQTALTNLSNIFSWLWNNIGKLANGVPQIAKAIFLDLASQASSLAEIIIAKISGKDTTDLAVKAFSNLGSKVEETLKGMGVSKFEVAEPDYSGLTRFWTDIARLDQERAKSLEDISTAAMGRVNAKNPAARALGRVSEEASSQTGQAPRQVQIADAMARGSEAAYRLQAKLQNQGSDKIEEYTKKTAENTSSTVNLLRDMRASLDMEVVTV